MKNVKNLTKNRRIQAYLKEENWNTPYLKENKLAQAMLEKIRKEGACYVKRRITRD